MIDTDHTQWFRTLWDFDVDDWFRKGGVDGVDRDWVVRVGGIAGDIGDGG